MRKEALLRDPWRCGMTAVLAGLLITAGCSVDELEMPALDGPATLGLQLIITANPDIVIANGMDTSDIGLLLLNNNGQPVSGRQIAVSIADPTGYYAEVGHLSQDYVTTDGGGRAGVIYHAPVRTDHAGDGYVLVMGRPVSTDWAGELYRSVRIEVRAAEIGRFPTGTGTLTCGFVIEPGSGPYYTTMAYPLQSTSKGNIIRYEWNFGDGRSDDKPDTVHVWHEAGDYSIILVVTDRSGAQDACERGITVE